MRAARRSPVARRATRAWLVAVCLAAAPTIGAAAPSPLDLRVEFAADGTCRVHPAPATPPSSAANDPDALRCALPRLSTARPVVLTVVLPAGYEPAPASFPRFAWTRAGGRLTGVAHLPGVPAFVRVPPADGRSARAGRWLDALALAAAAIGVLLTVAWGRHA